MNPTYVLRRGCPPKRPSRRSPRGSAWIIELDRRSADLEQEPSMVWSVFIAVAALALLEVIVKLG